MRLARLAPVGLLCAALAIPLAVPRSASASGFDLTRIGSERGHAAAPTPFATYLNPAALGGTQGLGIASELSLVLRKASYTRDESDVPEPADAAGANTGTAELFNAQVGPTVATSLKLGDFALGLGFFAPMSGAESWDGNGAFAGNDQYPGAVDGVARWWVIEGDQRVLYTSLAGSYTIAPWRLSLGVSANLVYTRIRLARAYTLTGEDRLAAEGRIDLNTNAVTGSFGAGVLWEAIEEALWFGVSYQAPPGLYRDVTLTGDVRVFITESETDAVSLKQAFPDVVRWAVRYHQPRYELRLFGNLERWSVFERQCVVRDGVPCDLNPDGSAAGNPTDIIANQPRHWRNGFAVRTGGSYYFSNGWEVLLGLGYDSVAIPRRWLEPTMIDGNEISVTGGMRIAAGKVMGFMLTYTHTQTLDIRVKNSALDDPRPPSRLPAAAGDYKQWFGTLSGMLEFYLPI